jgi:predicted rRNA methylase YqxC with S4 and FtsJ domains
MWGGFVAPAGSRPPSPGRIHGFVRERGECQWRAAPGARLLALVKPTFELREGRPISDPSAIEKAVDVASAAAAETGWRVDGNLPSPALGRARAPEVFLYATRRFRR